MATGPTSTGDRRSPSVYGTDDAKPDTKQLLPLLEAGVLLYLLLGVVALVAVGEFSGVPFQLFFISGFGLVTAANYRTENRYVRRDAAIAPAS